jgi:hypothetical protein
MFLGSVLAVFGVVLAVELLVHLAMFIGQRVRNEASAEKDPQLGRKFVLHLFLHYAILLILAGLTVSVCDLVDNLLFPWQAQQNNPFQGPGQWGPGGFQPAPPPAVRPSVWNENQRVAAALLLSGVLHLIILWMVIHLGTNSRRFPQVGRGFAMTRFALGGVIVMGTTTAFLVYLFQEGNTDVKAVSYVLGFALVWGPFTLGHLFWVLNRCKKDNPKAGSKGRQEEPPRREEDEEDEG